MIFSISTAAWIAVIILQVLIHNYVVNRRLKDQEDAIAKKTSSSESLETNDRTEDAETSVRRAYSREINDVDADESSVDARSEFEKEMHLDLDEPDERDSFDDVREECLTDLIQKTSALEPTESKIRNRKRHLEPLDLNGDTNRLGSTQTHKSATKLDKTQTSEEIAERNNIQTKNLTQPLEEADRGFSDESDDFDSIDDDEQWRYELVKQYYSSSTNSILTIASRSISEPDDPALESIENIHDLSRKLLKSHSAGPPLDEHVRFQSNSSPVQVMPTIQCI